MSGTWSGNVTNPSLIFQGLLDSSVISSAVDFQRIPETHLGTTNCLGCPGAREGSGRGFERPSIEGHSKTSRETECA